MVWALRRAGDSSSGGYLVSVDTESKGPSRPSGSGPRSPRASSAASSCSRRSSSERADSMPNRR